MKRTYSLSRTVRTACEPTPEVMAIAQQFGIGVDEEHEVVLFDKLEVSVGTGRVVYITGESGAGKTSLLSELLKAAAPDFAVMTVDPDKPDAPDQPLINQFSCLREAMEILTYAGLGEAFVMLRKPRELSDGQRYRLGIARAIAWARDRAQGSQQVLVGLDEFLAKLDRTTARAVASSVRKVATGTGICFAVATTHEDIAADLNPNLTVRLEMGRPPVVERRIVA